MAFRNLYQLHHITSLPALHTRISNYFYAQLNNKNNNKIIVKNDKQG